MRVFSWLGRALIFCLLFAFALNNQHEAELRWFPGFSWHAPMIVMVLGAFMLGCLVTLMLLVPGWWKLRRRAQAADKDLPLPVSGRRVKKAEPVPEPVPEMPPRDGL